MIGRSDRVLVFGGGVFGLTAALALRARGARVTLYDPGPLPHPLAASTDISKVVRLEYGPDAFYMSLMEEAREGWRSWNERARGEGREVPYVECGVLMLSREPMTPGGFEHESYRVLRARGHAPERLGTSEISARYPAWDASGFVDGFYHAKGGFAESGRVIEILVDWAREAGVVLEVGARLVGLSFEGLHRDEEMPARPVCGARIATATGPRDIAAEHVVLATGAWTGTLLPALAGSIRPSGHPVFHLRPRDPRPFAPDRFPVFTADVARTGYYGFPIGRAGVVKIGNHGVGRRTPPEGPREVDEAAHTSLRTFLADTFPALADAEIEYTRLCLYADTQDEDLWIARDPERPGLVVAGGGSGHGFKFGPVLGDLIADAVLDIPNPRLERFAWRPELRLARGNEAARCHDDPEPGACNP